MPAQIVPFNTKGSHVEHDYFAWLKQNPDGYVLNTTRKQPIDYYQLHTARCWHISKYSKNMKFGGFTQGELIKICSTPEEVLVEYTKQHSKTKKVPDQGCPCVKYPRKK